MSKNSIKKFIHYFTRLQNGRDKQGRTEIRMCQKLYCLSQPTRWLAKFDGKLVVRTALTREDNDPRCHILLASTVQREWTCTRLVATEYNHNKQLVRRCQWASPRSVHIVLFHSVVTRGVIGLPPLKIGMYFLLLPRLSRMSPVPSFDHLQYLDELYIAVQ